MNKIITVLSFALISTVAQAEIAAPLSNAAEASQNPVTSIAKETTDSVADAVQSNSKTEETENLWKSLDLNKDGAISKEEASGSNQLVAKWDSLDANKDDKIDTVEFVQFFYQEQ